MDQALQDAQARRTKQISRTIRQTLRDSLPGPDDQFLTVMIPGKVVDFDKFSHGFDKATGKLKTPLLPHAVQLAEAILCDDMPALGPLQLGPTGRSVARSYAATLSRLCPAGSTTGIADGTPHDELSDNEKRYKFSMEWLTARDPDNNDKTRVDIYREKQKAYTDAFEHKAEEYAKALRQATHDTANTSLKKQREAFDIWVEQNHKTYNNHVQAAYIDWVTMGKKEEVEYHFSIVDNDSAMSRVEASKECMRAAVISDTDGSSEYQKVKLEPENWAWRAKKKAGDKAPQETVENLTFQISRLEKINFLLRSMIAHPELVRNDASDEVAAATDAAGDPGKDFLQAQGGVREAQAAYSKAQKEGTPLEGTADAPGPKENLAAAVTRLEKARTALRKHFEEVDKKTVNDLSSDARAAQNRILAGEGLQGQVDANVEKITRLTARRDELVTQRNTKDGTDPVTSVQDDFADKAAIPRGPAPPAANDPEDDADYWTSISVEVSSSVAHESTETSSTSVTADVSVPIGFWSVSASATHSESHSAASKEMANASMKVSFQCMRVDITRPWLRGELFYDHELRVPEGDFVSPGPKRFKQLVDRSHKGYGEIAHETRVLEMDNYDLFPMYPTAFLLAANVVLEIHGETSSIQSYLSDSSTSASASVHYGPFSVGGGASGSNANSSSDSTCQATASGCRITIKSPQIIGWISQIVPELPRPKRHFVPDEE